PEAQRPEKLRDFLADESTAVRSLGLDLINALITDRKEVGQAIKLQLVEMITDPDAGLRRNVAAMVGDLRPSGAAARLRQALVRENDFRVRGAQVNALGRLDEADAIPDVIVCLDDEALEVVAEAALALGKLARQGHGLEVETVSRVASALLKRLEKASLNDEDLRVKLLEAMGRIGHENFFPVFKKEMEPHRGVRIRSAAIWGMSSLRVATNAANEIRLYISAADPEVRQAVAQALGRCGRNPEDLIALDARLDSGLETNPAVRERAWESYQSILRRSPASVQLEKGVGFAKAEDTTDQRRGLTLLKTLKTDQSRYDQLSPEDRAGLPARIASVQYDLGDYQAAAKSYEEALQSAKDPKSDQYRELALKLAATLLRLGLDERAFSQLRAIAVGDAEADVRFSQAVFDCLVQESQRRLAAAENAAQFAAALKLMESAESLSREIPPDSDQGTRGDALAKIRAKVIAKREAAVESLLAAITTDADAESKLISFGPETVLPKIYARLISLPVSVESAEHEAKLVEMARKLAPDWPGYDVGCPPEERDAALEKLKAGGEVPTADTTLTPASAPA
ncbi:MAG: HEAT repeat domain-containing protein, partial [Phycisphaerales bacterium]|nr:HEAT repeat domain-containing protein [Phycisphaerales bacterium]